jgi:hypothetical protein
VHPFNFRGTVKCCLVSYNDFTSFVRFLAICRLTKESAEKLAEKKNKKMKG